jgi:hypothetical protein
VIALLGIVLSPAYLVRGLSIGVAYGLLALGLVLVYRSSRFVNFAHGEIGAFGAAMLSVCVRKAGIPYRSPWLSPPDSARSRKRSSSAGSATRRRS